MRLLMDTNVYLDVALGRPGMPDFEDALQAAAAVACKAQVIITRNVRDFKKSPVPAMTPEQFVAKHM